MVPLILELRKMEFLERGFLFKVIYLVPSRTYTHHLSPHSQGRASPIGSLWRAALQWCQELVCLGTSAPVSMSCHMTRFLEL